MTVKEVIFPEEVLEKLEWKHNVRRHEVEEVLWGKPQIRFTERGERQGEDVYLAKGKTEAGRYLSVFFIYKKTQDALVLSVRAMTRKERRSYGKK